MLKKWLQPAANCYVPGLGVEESRKEAAVQIPLEDWMKELLVVAGVEQMQS